jgi:WD40 repeat protein
LYSGDIHRSGLVAAGTVFRSLLIWHSETGQLLRRLLGHTGVIFDVCFISETDQELVASVSDDRTVRVWKGDKQLATMYGHTARVWKVRPMEADEGIRLVSSSEDATVRLWQLSLNGDWQEQACLNFHIGKNVRAISVYQELIASGGEDSAIYLTNSRSL